MLPSRMSRTPAEDPLLEKNSRFLSEKRSKIITIFLYGMIASGILTITLSIVLLHIKVPEDQKCAKRVIGYFSDSPNLEITENQLKKLTHAVLSSDLLTNSGTIEFKNNHVENRLESLKKLSGDNTKVMISLGGNRFFSELLQTEKSRKLLAYNIVDFLVISQIDGVDLFWK
ncbi:unnamed protein product [Caenorhabditis nigoni]